VKKLPELEAQELEVLSNSDEQNLIIVQTFFSSNFGAKKGVVLVDLNSGKLRVHHRAEWFLTRKVFLKSNK